MNVLTNMTRAQPILVLVVCTGWTIMIGHILNDIFLNYKNGKEY